MEWILERIREKGWLVAGHNDYWEGGYLWTFWLFKKGCACIKGDARTDMGALELVWDQVKDHCREKGL